MPVLQEYGTSHTLPVHHNYHSQSNGKAEAAVKIAKGLLRKDDHDTFLAMLNWWNTPTQVSTVYLKNYTPGEPAPCFLL